MYVRVKAQWPLGARDVLLLCQGVIDPGTGSIYLGSHSTTLGEGECPPDPSGKFTRINTISGHYFFEALDERRRCKLHYITEFSFGGSIPKGLIQAAASEKFMGGI